MGGKIGGNLVSNVFQNVPYSKELAEVKEKVAELESKQGALEVLVAQIEPNPDQPRKTFNEESIALLACSLEQDGLQHPISVFARGKGKYFLFDGERRWRAARLLKWHSIQALIVPDPKDPRALHRKALLANHHRENMNPLDLAEALVKEIASTGKVGESEVPVLLNTAAKRLLRSKQLSRLTELVAAPCQQQEEGLQALQAEELLTEEEYHVLLVLLSLQLNPHSVNTNIMQSLRLYADLKKAIREKGLGVHQAFALQQLSPKNVNLGEKEAQKLRQRITTTVIDQKLSVADTRKLVSAEKEKAAATSSNDDGVRSHTKATIAKIEKIVVSDLETSELLALEATLAQKLKEIRANLREH